MHCHDPQHPFHHPSRPSHEPPWMEATIELSGCTGESGETQPVTPMVAVEPQQLFSMNSLPVQEDYLCQTILQGGECPWGHGLP